MDTVEMRERVAGARVGRLATVRPDGRPHVVPCCYVLHQDTTYSAVDDKPKTSLALARLANVRANPQATLLIDHYSDDWSKLWWVRIDGTARVLESGDERAHALELLAAKYEQYRRVVPPGAVLALDVSTWRAWP